MAVCVVSKLNFFLDAEREGFKRAVTDIELLLKYFVVTPLAEPYQGKWTAVDNWKTGMFSKTGTTMLEMVESKKFEFCDKNEFISPTEAKEAVALTICNDPDVNAQTVSTMVGSLKAMKAETAAAPK